MEEETMPAGAYRKPIYDLVQEIIGRNLTEDEHKRLHVILIKYIQKKEGQSADNSPKRYIYECRDCRKIRNAQGKKEHRHAL